MRENKIKSDATEGAAKTPPLMDIRNLKVYFPIKSGVLLGRTVGHIKAVDDVSLHINPGATLGLVGESGSGKPTLGRAALQLIEPTDGQVIFDGQELRDLSSQEMRQRRRELGFVFQDPYGSLNPRMTAGNMIGEPLKIHKLHSGKEDRRRQGGDLLSRRSVPGASVKHFYLMWTGRKGENDWHPISSERRDFFSTVKVYSQYTNSFTIHAFP